ncbi:MAG: hypothetical protein N2484_13025 [Clostridia bacterium]|nr:hypothetical protein [Clostridia bacterium]
MNDTLIKDIVTLKLKIADSFTEMLPRELRENVKQHQKVVIQVLNEVTQEYLADHAQDKKENALKKVSIE